MLIEPKVTPKGVTLERVGNAVQLLVHTDDVPGGKVPMETIYVHRDGRLDHRTIRLMAATGHGYAARFKIPFQNLVPADE